MMISNRRGPVVVGIDGSDEATRAGIYGAWEAKRLSVPLRLIYAHNPYATWGSATLVADDGSRSWGEDMLRRAEKDIVAVHTGVSIEIAVIEASPAAALVEESRGACLVVVGTRAVAGLKGHIAGSVAAQVAAHAASPVVILRPGDVMSVDPGRFGSRPVMVGMDGSAESQRALRFAAEEAVARGTDVHAVFVVQARDLHDISPIVTDLVASTERADAARMVIDATEDWADRFPELVIHHRVVHADDPAESLAGISAEAGLVVVGSRGRGGFLGLRLGSTGDGLIRRSGTTVVIVPAEASAA
jgi:nucleotide-binding universal stress UspA family protein